MELTLNIYKGREIEKTYTVREVDIMLGTVEDLINLIEPENLMDDTKPMDMVGAVTKLVKDGFAQVKGLIMEIFPEVTEEEMRRTKVKEIVQILVKVVKYGFAEMTGASNSKN